MKQTSSPSPSKLPEAFLQRLEQLIPSSKLDACLSCFDKLSATAFRVNTLKTSVDELVAELSRDHFNLTTIDWYPGAFFIPDDQRGLLTHHASFREGRIYIQNPSSMLSPLVLNPGPDDWVLDLAAAPGGKTLQLAALMNNRGLISAVEAVKPRFFRLKANLKTFGVKNVRCYLKDGSRVWKSCPEQFDKILLDAPCSSEARFKTNNPDSFAYWSNKKIKDMTRKQLRLLFSAIQSLKPAGDIVYSTCSFSPEENELIIDKMLQRFGNALQITAIELPIQNIQHGLTEWQGKSLHADLKRAIRVLPNEYFEGFFICKLVKTQTTLEHPHGYA